MASNWQGSSPKGKTTEAGKASTNSGGGTVDAENRPSKPEDTGLPLPWCLCESEDRCGSHRGPAGWGVPGCSFFFWLMKG